MLRMVPLPTLRVGRQDQLLCLSRGLIRSAPVPAFLSPWIAAPEWPWARSCSSSVGLPRLLLLLPSPLLLRIVQSPGFVAPTKQARFLSRPRRDARRTEIALRRRFRCFAERLRRRVEPGAQAAVGAAIPNTAAQELNLLHPRGRFLRRTSHFDFKGISPCSFVSFRCSARPPRRPRRSLSPLQPRRRPRIR